MEIGLQLKVSSDRLVKPGIQHVTPDLQCECFIYYNTAASFCIAKITFWTVLFDRLSENNNNLLKLKSRLMHMDVLILYRYCLISVELRSWSGYGDLFTRLDKYRIFFHTSNCKSVLSPYVYRARIIHPSQQYFSHVGMSLPVLNQFYGEDKVSCSRTQHSACGESRASNPSI